MDRESVNIGIRSVLNSSREPLTINELWQDYIKITGSPVPLRELGYRSLHDYLRSIPDKVSLDDPNSPYSIVRAVSNEKSKHIEQFVKTQKISKNSRPPPRRRIPRAANNCTDFVPLSLQRRVLDMLTRYSDGLHLQDFRELVADIQREMQLKCQFDSILRQISAHIVFDGDDIRLSGQYLKQYAAQNSQNPPRRPNEIILIDDSGTEDDEYDDFLSDPSGSDDYAYISPTRSPDDARQNSTKRIPSTSGDEASRPGPVITNRSLISDTLVKNCYALLDENPNGFWLAQLASKYESKFGYVLDPLQHGFDCVLDMVMQLKDVFNMIKYEKSGDRFLRDARKFPTDSPDGEVGELPKSVVLEIKKLLLKRSNHQLYTDELATEYRECYKKTLDPTDYGFKNMDGLLKSLNDNESSVFSFKQVRQRTVMYLRGVPNEDQSYAEEGDSDGALPCNYDFNFLPREVCNYDFKLSINPVLQRLLPGDRIVVRMAEVYGPERFFLHFADDVDSLNSMMEDLHIFYENNSNTYEISHDTVRRGMLCACPFHQDSKWHRVQVVTCRGTSDCKVRYFDYGTIREVSVGKLRYLHVDFARLPALCVRAKLSGVKTKKFDESKKEEQRNYSRLVGESFFDLANDAKKLEAEVRSVDVVNQCIEVHLFATYDGGKVISIHEKLISDGLVLNKEIVDVAEIPLPPAPSPKPIPATKVTSSSLPNASTTSTANSTGQDKSKKNRPPPGIPIPHDLNTPATSASMSTQTPSQRKPTYNGYTQSKMNPLNPPFYPSGYNAPPAQSTPPSVYAMPAAQSMPPMGPPMPPQQFMYTTPRLPMYPLVGTYPPVSMYNPYGVPPHPQTMYDYYANLSPAATMRPLTSAAPYASHVNSSMATAPTITTTTPASKPPPGLSYKPAKVAPDVPTVANATGIPLYYSRNLPKSQTTTTSDQAKTQNSMQQQNNKPEWISKLEVVRDLVLKKDMSPASVTDRLKEIIGDINADEPKKELVENRAKPANKQNTCSTLTAATAILENSLSNDLNGLSIKDQRSSSTPLPASAFTSTFDLLDTSPVSPSAGSESEFSVKSEGKESTKDEITQAKIEQLRLFVMLQNKNLKKT